MRVIRRIDAATWLIAWFDGPNHQIPHFFGEKAGFRVSHPGWEEYGLAGADAVGLAGKGELAGALKHIERFFSSMKMLSAPPLLRAQQFGYMDMQPTRALRRADQ